MAFNFVTAGGPKAPGAGRDGCDADGRKYFNVKELRRSTGSGTALAPALLIYIGDAVLTCTPNLKRRTKMKTLALVTTSLVAVARGWAGDADVIPSVALVHVDGRDVDTYYNYLAAIPVYRFWDGGRATQAPLLTDEAPIPADSGAAASRLVVIGEAPEARVAEVRAAYGVSAAHTFTVDGAVPAVAGTMAENWARACDVVVAPYADDEAAVASASYAAALASALNAPLLYTCTNRVPYETLSALGRLGARNVFIVDFGPSCSETVLAGLVKGRNLGRRFARPDEVSSFVEHTIRRGGIKNLPREA
jgi:hypothetical protein